MARTFSSLFIFLFVFASAYWLWETQPAIQRLVQKNLSTGDFLTLETRYDPNEIIEKHDALLSLSKEHERLEPRLIFHPFAYMEVKFVHKGGSTGEGVSLWGLLTGEMLITTKDWQETHGYEDCIIAEANKRDFNIINALADSGGALDREGLLHKLFVESELLDSWIESCKQKQLIVQSGNTYHLHFESPLLAETPETHLSHHLDKKSYKYSERISPKYSIEQIETLSKAAFGEGFSIRNTEEVYLPVYVITVKNPDGSLLITEWNAVSGEQIERR